MRWWKAVAPATLLPYHPIPVSISYCVLMRSTFSLNVFSVYISLEIVEVPWLNQLLTTKPHTTVCCETLSLQYETANCIFETQLLHTFLECHLWAYKHNGRFADFHYVLKAYTVGVWNQFLQSNCSKPEPSCTKFCMETSVMLPCKLLAPSVILFPFSYHLCSLIQGC